MLAKRLYERFLHLFCVVLKQMMLMADFSSKWLIHAGLDSSVTLLSSALLQKQIEKVT